MTQKNAKSYSAHNYNACNDREGIKVVVGDATAILAALETTPI